MMLTRIVSITLLAALAATTSALKLNNPPAVWTIGTQQTVTWESSSSDPASFSLFIHDSIETPNPLVGLAASLATDAHSYTFTVPELSPAGDGWTLWAVNITNVNIVYATSDVFTVEAA